MSAFNRLMTHDVIPIQVTTDFQGEETETPLSTEKGFFEYNEKNRYNAEGEVYRSSGILFLKADSVFDVTATDDNGNKVKWKFTDVKNDRTFQAEEPQIIDDPRTGNTHHYEILLR